MSEPFDVQRSANTWRTDGGLNRYHYEVITTKGQEVVALLEYRHEATRLARILNRAVESAVQS